MNDLYKKYIINRLKKDNKRISNQHLCAITAVDYYRAEKEFYLLQFYHSECLLLKCKTNETNQQKRIGIVLYKKYRHSLNNIYKDNPESNELTEKCEKAYYLRTNGSYQYDSYYDTLSPTLKKYNKQIDAALNEIQLDDNMPVYVCSNKKYSTKAVVYALQKKAVKVVLMEEVKGNLDIIESKRVLHLQDFSKMYLNTVPVMSVADCFSPQTMYIPVSEFTLDSEFCNGKKWRDLIANTETDDCCIINGIQCKCVTIKMKIDIFNNVFCTTQSFNGEQKTVLLQNALGVDWEQEKSMSNSVSPNSDIQVIKSKETEDIKNPLKSDSPAENTMISQNDKQNSDEKVGDKRTFITKDSSDGFSIPVENSNNRENIKKDINLTEKNFTIEKGSIYTYFDLFGDYLIGAEEIKIEDGYVYQGHQIGNLGYLIQTAITVNLDNANPKCLKKVHLITKEASVCIKEDKKDQKKCFSMEEAVKNQIKEFARLKDQFKEEGIDFSYTLDNDVHDREITLSNGWTITLGRGLDIFNKPRTKWSPRTCKYTKIEISRTDKMATPQKKKKTI